ncbi:MAG: restriction endonuclease subunit S [Treponema sp.]|nr:restriction endonuclease subunit S [Treponema sp.]
MKRITLGEIADIQIGLLLSRKQADDASPYRYRRLLPRSLRPGGTISLDETEPYNSLVPLNRAVLTRAGTIVMKLSYPFNPALVNSGTENLVVPSQMAVIRLRGAVMPEYIRIYLSQERIAGRLLSNYALIAQKGVTIQTLSNLRVEIPSRENQRRICEYYGSYYNLRSLREELDREEQKMLTGIFSALSKDRGVNHDKR